MRSVDSVRIPWYRSTVLPELKKPKLSFILKPRLARRQGVYWQCSTNRIGCGRSETFVYTNLTNNARNTYCSADSNYSCLSRHALANFSNCPVALTHFVDSVRFESTNIISVTVYRRKVIIIIIIKKKPTFFRHTYILFIRLPRVPLN